MNVLPARAGMSPVQTDLWTSATRAPRASGDEPTDTLCRAARLACSPRERG